MRLSQYFQRRRPKLGRYLGFIVYQVYLNEDENDVTRKNLEDVEVVISPIGRSCGL
jgi:hypothetical protein